MPQFGTVKRQYPRVEVLRGFNPNEPFTLTQAYPVADGVTILSGQVISKSWNAALGQYEWVLGWTAGVPFIAYNDDQDKDVLEAGTLPGLSSAGQFEIQTAFWKAADEALFVVDTPVCPDGVTGNIKVATANDGVPVLGYVTRNHGPLDLGPTGSGNNGHNSNAVHLEVVSFQTAFDPNPA